MSLVSRDIYPHLDGTRIHRFPSPFLLKSIYTYYTTYSHKELHGAARNNLTWIKGDNTSDVYYDDFHLDSKDDQYFHFRLYLMIKSVVGAAAVKGVRVYVYGPLAELVYGHVRKGSWLGVIGHIQQRTTRKGDQVCANKYYDLTGIP